MGQTQAHTVKPGNPPTIGHRIPPEPPVSKKQAWYKRAWNWTKGLLRKSKDGVVFAYDYCVVRVKTFVGSMVHGGIFVISWTIALPVRLFRYFWGANANSVVMDEVHDRQVDRKTEAFNRQQRRQLQREQKAANRRAARLAQASPARA